MKRILLFALLAVSVIVLSAFASAPGKKFLHDGLILSPTTEHVLDWDKLAADKRVHYVYFEVPTTCDTAILRENMALAQAKGLKTGFCFVFTDSLQKVSAIVSHLNGVPKEFSQVSPMISLPDGCTFDRRGLHRLIQIWANVINKHYGEQPILKANRENCKDYLAPVLTSTYRICLVFAEGKGSYMLQNPEPYRTADPELVAYPCRVFPE